MEENKDRIKCSECLEYVEQEELDMFGGLCEECTMDEEVDREIRTPAKVITFENGMVMVFGFDGKQIPALQGVWLDKEATIRRAATSDTVFEGPLTSQQFRERFID